MCVGREVEWKYWHHSGTIPPADCRHRYQDSAPVYEVSEVSTPSVGERYRVLYHFKKWCASAVEINTAQFAECVVNRLTSIFFKMSAYPSNVVVGISHFKANRSPTDDGQFKLTDLVALG
ncbi:MAG: hypothetical protein CM1200mP41_39200 [Gammaproteobacteria bacterium]|nr:MAG: hypothetical protein CM1200mP41_39200 [Gammaproteobacteria bacterium]